MNKTFDVAIIGAGTGGIITAAQLLRKNPELKTVIIDPSENHWYQAAWTLVGAGTFNMEATRRPTSSLIPKGAEWIKQRVENIIPEKNELKLDNGESLQYKVLVVSTGLVFDFDALPGLREAMQKDNVCSNYIDPEKTWKVLQNFKGGNALFTQPSSPIKCGGAPQKIMYLAEEAFRKTGVRDKTKVIYATPGSVIFGVKVFADTLMNIIHRKGIVLKTFYNPVRIDAENNAVYFRYTKPGENGCVVTEEEGIHEQIVGEAEIKMPYDMLHLAPPQAAPEFIRNSVLAHQEGPNKGWMNVNINTLQSVVYPNIFGIGDVVALPTAKTGAAIRKQAPVVVDGILHYLQNEKLGTAQYEGYSSCPLVTGYGKMVLAEFKYNNVRDSDPLLSKLFDTTKELWAMWILKKYMLPWLYWNKMMKGKM
ncbi:MAG: NAD(P)/FAD-dependent oxidoreductase [Flavobacteriales bacterium]|nr:NAD(P)/FAD-dependent oxidoreductase [Flavobacteriales bacterium]